MAITKHLDETRNEHYVKDVEGTPVYVGDTVVLTTGYGARSVTKAVLAGFTNAYAVFFTHWHPRDRYTQKALEAYLSDVTCPKRWNSLEVCKWVDVREDKSILFPVRDTRSVEHSFILFERGKGTASILKQRDKYRELFEKQGTVFAV